MISIRSLTALAVAFLAALSASAIPGASDGPRTRYATDAYPGFDRDSEIGISERKTPRWFSWINGPAKDTPAAQLAYAKELAGAESWGSARKACDALVREWPSSPEAPRAQEMLADILLEHTREYDSAFFEYKYLVDYYSSQCDFTAVLYRMYEVAKLMRENGKRLLFFRFDNTVETRQAFEAVVVRAPGAHYAPAAMTAVAELLEEDHDFDRAIQVYGNLRCLYQGGGEARAALRSEGAARMRVLRAHEYNRRRCLETIGFMKTAISSSQDAAERAEFESWLAEAVALVEDEAYRAAKFYDSRTRTKASAVNAYEKFLSEYPASSHAEEARARLDELRKEAE
ncbi:MAG: hypothetical protein IJI73_11755 [Kiritimatiellae bacterium]|nr:hypothetical protein [Kiritimatiellia bacterium]